MASGASWDWPGVAPCAAASPGQFRRLPQLRTSAAGGGEACPKILKNPFAAPSPATCGADSSHRQDAGLSSGCLPVDRSSGYELLKYRRGRR